ncbi:MAG: hypothetical protein AAGA96_12295 [Verrucomicrobiota bacterium]
MKVSDCICLSLMLLGVSEFVGAQPSTEKVTEGAHPLDLLDASSTFQATELDNEVGWGLNSKSETVEGVYREGRVRVLRTGDSEANFIFATVPFTGDFDISGRIGLGQELGGSYGGGFVVSWGEGQGWDALMRMPNRSLRVVSTTTDGSRERRHTIGAGMINRFPWIRLRSYEGTLTVYLSKDRKKWQEKYRFDAISDRGRVGLSVFGNSDLGERSVAVEDLHLAVEGPRRVGLVVRPEGQVRRILSGVLVDQEENLIEEAEEIDRDEPNGMLVETWKYPVNRHSLGSIPSEIEGFPGNAESAQVVAGLEEVVVEQLPAILRGRSTFQAELGGIYGFSLEGVRSGHMKIRELGKPGAARLPEEIVFSFDSNQRFGGGTVFLRKDKWYELEVIGLHREEEMIPGLKWYGPGIPEAVTFAPKHQTPPRSDFYDEDGDLLPDLWEQIAIGDRASGMFDDPDRDELPNYVEWKIGSDPLSADTDGDGAPDGIEEALGHLTVTDPALVPSTEVSEGWRRGFVAPEAMAVDRNGDRELPDSDYFFQGNKGPVLLGDGATFRGNRAGWVPFLHRQLDGDFDLKAKVNFPTNLPDLSAFRAAAGGLMVRQSLDSTSPFEFSVATGKKGQVLVKRIPMIGSTQTPVYEFAYGGGHAAKFEPAWVRMIRSHGSLTAAWSPDGQTWLQAGDSVEVSAGPVLVGMIGLGNVVKAGRPAARFEEIQFSDPRERFLSNQFQGVIRWDAADGSYKGFSDREEVAMGLKTWDHEAFGMGIDPTQGVSLPTSTEHVVSGIWNGAGSIGLYPRVGDGGLAYPLQVIHDGLYRAVLEVGPALRYGDRSHSFHELRVGINGYPPRTYTVMPNAQGRSFFAFPLPALPVGPHQVTVSSFSPRPGKALPIAALHLEKVAIFDVNQEAPEIERQSAAQQMLLEQINERVFGERGAGASGDFKEILSNREAEQELIQHRNQLPSGEMASAVSPAFVSGTAAFPESVLATFGEEGNSLEVEAGPDQTWFANVPLLPTESTSLVTQAENGSVVTEASVSWVVTDLAAQEEVFLREGDSLKLAAMLEGNALAALFVNEEKIGSVRGAEFLVHQFDEAGEYQVIARSPDGKVIRDLKVRIPRVVFRDDPVAMVGRQRIWNVGNVDVDHIEFAADRGLSFRQLSLKHVPGEPPKKQFSLAVPVAGDYPIQALLPNGVVADQVVVKGVRLYKAPEGSIEHVNHGDEGRLVVMEWPIPELPDTVTYQVRIIAGTGVFTDGSIIKEISASDRDAYGRIRVEAIQPPGELRAICHQVFVFDGNEFIGSL